jgi:hypothetical protein
MAGCKDRASRTRSGASHRPCQGLRIVGAAIERSGYGVGDACTARRRDPNSHLVPRIERGFAAKGPGHLLALLVRTLAHAFDEWSHGPSGDLGIINGSEQQLDRAFVDPQVSRLTDLTHEHFPPLRGRQVTPARRQSVYAAFSYSSRDEKLERALFVSSGDRGDEMRARGAVQMPQLRHRLDRLSEISAA